MKPYIGVKQVKAIDDYKLLLTFTNGEQGTFDMKPYLNKGIFKELNNIVLFSTAHVCFDTVEWDNEADFDPEVLYSGSKKVRHKKEPVTGLAVSLASEPTVKYKKNKR